MTAQPDALRLAWAVVPPERPRRDVAWDLLRELLPEGATLRNACPRCGEPHGPVQVDGADAVASVSYAGGFALVGVGDARIRMLGIDAESLDTAPDDAELARILGPAHPPTLREWTRVESALKADGRGLRVDPARVIVTALADGHWWATVPGGGAFEGWDAAGPPGLVVSIAARRA